MKKFTIYLCFFLLFMVCISYSHSQTYGDANNDGIIDIIDALLTAQFYVGLDPQGIDTTVMDVNADGSIDIVDALLIAQYYVGLITDFPAANLSTPNPTPIPATTGAPTAAATNLPSVTNPPTTTNPPGVTSAATPAGTSAPTSPSSVTSPPAEGTPMPAVSPDPDESNFFYFSYDDSASTASVELTKYKLLNGDIPDPGLARTWEFLNFEEFNPASVTNTGLFNVSMGLWERDSLKTGYTKEYKLGVYLASPDIPKEERKNIVLTILVDISGSMGSQSLRVDDQVYTRMDLVHYGLNVLPDSLKEGDVINIATFDTTARIVHQGLQIPLDTTTYLNAVEALTPTGTTNLAAGIDVAYQAALNTYDPEKTNRVIILTDAYANTGEIDPGIIAQNVVINNQEGIYFSGLGISDDFNEAFLNELTDTGKGAYFSIITQNDAQRAFKDRFIALISVAAKDVQFRIDYPIPLKHDETAAEETSGDPAEVETTNFSYNTSQYFFEGFLAESEDPLPESTFKLTIIYKNPADGTEVIETYEKTISELIDKDINLIRDAETIFLFTKLFGLQKTWAEISPVLTTYYSDYSSPLYTEYRNLMQLFLGDEVDISPDPVNFGSVAVGNSATQRVTITNTTNNPVEISNIYFDDPGSPNPFSITATIPATLPSMGIYTFQVNFAADTAGNFTKVLIVDLNSTEEMELYLTGAAVEPTPTPTPLPEIQIIPNPVEFGSVLVGDIFTRTVTIANNSTNDVDIYSIFFTNAPSVNPFSITSTLPATIPALGEFAFQVHFAPESENNFTAILNISWSISASSMDINLYGTGGTSVPTVVPTPVPTMVPTPM
ncbi:MAG: choice-of-anchor D domain-containing protein [Spirochaetales bacterium]|nr:choice-of-anchor D domain-containing protein [Spirochaetales bacterium]